MQIKKSRNRDVRKAWAQPTLRRGRQRWPTLEWRAIRRRRGARAADAPLIGGTRRSGGSTRTPAPVPGRRARCTRGKQARASSRLTWRRLDREERASDARLRAGPRKPAHGTRRGPRPRTSPQVLATRGPSRAPRRTPGRRPRVVRDRNSQSPSSELDARRTRAIASASASAVCESDPRMAPSPRGTGDGMRAPDERRRAVTHRWTLPPPGRLLADSASS